MSKNEITIKNFGPIESAKVDVNKKFQIFIGAQASGKSTICKVMYFCQKIKDYTLEFLIDSKNFMNHHRNEYFAVYLKFLTRQFMGCFGTTKHMQKFEIVYQFSGRRITIFLNDDGYVRFRFSSKLKEEIKELIGQAEKTHAMDRLERSLLSLLDNISVLAVMRQQLSERLALIFGCEAEVIYIPAGRSLLATMSEQLQDISVAYMDLTMQEFIKLIRTTRSKFGTKVSEMVESYTKTVSGQINNSAVQNAMDLIKRILKADYASEDDGEKIYFDEQHWVKLMYGSSGQQEALWILMLAFVVVLEKKKTIIVIEEPEAHLFPMAQKDIMSLIALMVNTTDSKVIITTHSPYILTSANILLYSDWVEKDQKKGEKVIVAKNYRIAFDQFAAYKVGRFETSIQSLMDEESHMIDTNYIDEVSSVTNEELDRLLDMEINA